MSERFQKTFISVREFVESWDKEIYELTNLDFFIYLMVNHLGNQVDKNFFVNEREDSRIYLTFNNIGTLCFNLGDSFEYFLEEDYYDDDSTDFLFDLQSEGSASKKNQDKTNRRIKKLKAFLSEGILKEQNFRVELMEHVILDTLLQFYYEEIGIEFEEDDLEIVALADFIEDIIIEFIRSDGQSLLQRPGDPAMDYFEGLLESEEDFIGKRDWDDEEDDLYEHDAEWADLGTNYEDISETIQKFIDDTECKPPEISGCVSKDIELFRSYLSDHVGINYIYEINEEHFLEFLSVWLVQKFAQEDEPQFPHIFQTLARFVTWLSHNYNIDYKRSFLNYYEHVKTEVPRVVNVLNTYLDEYDLFEILLLRGSSESHQVSGFYEIKKARNRISKTLDLVNVHLYDEVENVKLNSSIYSKLKAGDVLQATLIQRGNKWEVLEIQYIYPKVSKPFVH